MTKLFATLVAAAVLASSLALTPAHAGQGGYAVFVPDGQELKKINRRASLAAREYCEQKLKGIIAVDVDKCRRSNGRDCPGYCKTDDK